MSIPISVTQRGGARGCNRLLGGTSLAVLVLGLVPSVGCGRVAYERRAADGSADAGRPQVDSGRPQVDAGRPQVDAATRLDASVFSRVFGSPTRIDELSDPAFLDGDPTLTGDLLEIYFTSTRPGGAGGPDIWVATRASPLNPWSPPAPATELNSAGEEITPEVLADGLTIYFTSRRLGGTGGDDIWVSFRRSRGAPWGAPAQARALNTPANEAAAAPNPPHLQIVLDSVRAGGVGGEDLYLALRAGTGAIWGSPRAIGELNTSGHEREPFLSRGGLDLLFTSDAAGQFDLYRASRASFGDPFAPPTAIAELNSAANEGDAWLSADGRHIVFSSVRSGNSEIYEASR